MVILEFNLQMITQMTQNIIKMEQYSIKDVGEHFNPSPLHKQQQQQQYSTFRDIRSQISTFGKYQKRLFILMGFYWITASFFLILPFYFFKSAVYCQQPVSIDGSCPPCVNDCQQQLCQKPNVSMFINPQNTLTYRFQLFCENQSWRIFYKICPESLSWIGLLIYGRIGDKKGRKIAFKISWRLYTIGLIFFTTTETQFLMTFGYFIACVNCFPSLVIQFMLLFEQIDRSLRLKACYLLLGFLLVAPLLTSFLAGYLVQAGLKITLTVLCTIPSIVLSIMAGFLQQSAIYTYKDDKLLAFSILNQISRINGNLPITIDLSHSSWVRFNHYKVGLRDIMRHPPTRNKLLIGFLLMFTFSFNSRFAQISLDEFTNEYLRGTLMNGTSAIATISVIILVTHFKMTRYTCLSLLTIVVSLVYFIFTLMDIQNFWLQSTVSIALRYLSNLSYSIFLIWTIQIFPTVCRAQCLSFSLCGVSFGAILAYSLYNHQKVQLSIILVFNLAVLILSHPLKLDYQNKLIDTLTEEYYDEKDRFKRII